MKFQSQTENYIVKYVKHKKMKEDRKESTAPVWLIPFSSDLSPYWCFDLMLNEWISGDLLLLKTLP